MRRPKTRRRLTSAARGEFVASMSRHAAPKGAVLPRPLAAPAPGRGETRAWGSAVVLALVLMVGFAPAAGAAQQGGGTGSASQHAAPSNAPPPAAPPQAAAGASAGGAALTPAQLDQAIDALKNPKQRDALIATLEAMRQSAKTEQTGQQAKSSSATKSSSVAKTLSSGASASQQKAAQAAAAAVHAAATGVLGAISHFLGRVGRDIGPALHSATNVELLWHWLVFVATNVWLRATVLHAAGRLALVLSTALAAEYVAILALARPRAWVIARGAVRQGDESGGGAAAAGSTPETGSPSAAPAGGGAGEAAAQQSSVPALTWRIVGRRLPYAALHLLLSLAPILVFALVGLLWLQAGPVTGRVATLVVTATLNAYLACRGALELVRFVVAPHATALRLVPMSDFRADWLLRWLRRLTAVVAFGYAAISTGSLFGLYAAARNVLLKLVSLVAHLIVAVMIIQIRRPVARLIRGRSEGSALIGSIRAVMARTWHVLALFYVLSLWGVWAAGVPHAFGTMLRVVFELAVVLAAAQAVTFGLVQAIASAFGEEAGWKQVYPGLHARGRQFVPVIRTVIETVVNLFAVLAILQLWGLNVAGWLTRTPDGRRVLGGVLTIAATTVLAIIAWEFANIALEARIDRLARQGRPGRAARYRTLVPMLRTTLLVTILTIAGLVVLAAIGVNVTLLVGGLSIFGLAVGFGSQKLVQDIITGLFLLLEDAMQVGDWVTVGGMFGLVEKLSIRTIRLRGVDGSLNIIPFSAVTTISNSSREFAYAVVNIGVAFRENIDHVFALIEDEFSKIRADPAWKSSISGDLELWGLDSFGASSLNIVGRIRCPAGKQWAVKREFNRRLKIRFDEEGVEIPFPYQRLTIDPAEFRAAFGTPQAGGGSAAPPAAEDASPAEGEAGSEPERGRARG